MKLSETLRWYFLFFSFSCSRKIDSVDLFWLDAEFTSAHHACRYVDITETVITFKIVKSYMSFRIFLIMDDLSFCLFDLELSTRSEKGV